MTERLKVFGLAACLMLSAWSAQAAGDGASVFANEPMAPTALETQRGGATGDEPNLRRLVEELAEDGEINAVSGTAFRDTRGIVNVLQNSGNGAVLQNSTAVNVTLGAGD